MLSCHNCMRRCLQTIIGESATLSSPLKPYLSLGHYGSRATRRALTVPRSLGRASTPHQVLAEGIPLTSSSRTGRKDRRQQWLESRGIRPKDKPARDQDWAIRRNLQFLNDPLKLAEHVRKSLRAGNFETTLATVRVASRDVQCTVSWNHLIDWQLSKGKMNAALSTYNEMKKRAQMPDAQTYTIIFRGCAEHRDSAQALLKVMSIYQGMLAEKSPIKPNVIHMNALLKMCGRANDIDALFAIANDLPASGIRSANNTTYTTIINALRMNAFVTSSGDRTPMQNRKLQREAILRARQMWQDITQRWRKGDILVDEELVCTMGRLLLLGDTNDSDDVLSLIEQTMNIPRQIPRMGSSARTRVEPASQGRLNADPDAPPAGSAAEISHNQGGSLIQQFVAIEPARPTALSLGFYAKPGRNSLSLVMHALLDISKKQPAAKYWDIFTRKHGVIPDAENFHAYLRILRLCRSSTEAVELLLKMPKEFMAGKTFRIAMSTCDRDKLNRHAFSNAGKILDLMQTHLSTPDIPALQTYVNVAVEAQAYSPGISSNGESHPSKIAQGKQILRALDRLNPSFVNLRSLLSYGDQTDAPADSKRLTPQFTREVLHLTQLMIRATDILMNKALVPREIYSDLTAQRNKFTAFVTKYKHIKPDFYKWKTVDRDFKLQHGQIHHVTPDIQETRQLSLSN